MLQRFITNLKERKIIQRLTIYLGGWWGLLEVFEFFTNRFEWDPIWVKSLTIVGLVLIPSAVILSWYGFADRWWRKQLIFYLLNFFALALILYYTPSLKKNEIGLSENLLQPSKSIAVLPFANLSPDTGKDYFSEGVADEMINLLSRVPSLKVTGRHSSFQFKGKNLDLREIGKRLGVVNLLEGTVRQTADKVRISVSLINALDGTTMWSDSYDKQIEEVLKIQDEIALVVVSKLKIAMLEGLAKSPSVNREAFDSYLKGKDAWNLRKLKESETYFKRAIEIDSLFAPAYSGLAETYMLFPYFGGGSQLEYLPKAQAAAEKAIQIDASLSAPFLVLGMKNIHFDLNLVKARKNFLEAIQKNPDYAPNHYLFGHLLTFESNFEESIKETQKSIELDPLSPVANANMGRILLISQRYTEAIKFLKLAIDLTHGQNHNAFLHLGNCYLEMGKLKEAEEAYIKSRDLRNDRAMACLINLYMKQGKIKEAKEIYTKLNDQASRVYVSRVTLACAASFMKEKDKAHDLFKKAFEMHGSWLIAILEYTTKQPNDLLSDPRNKELYKRFLPSVRNAWVE